MSALLLVALLFWAAGFALLGRLGPVPYSPARKKEFPRLSIIIPARNEEKNLPRLLSSLAAQSARAFEIIVVDDHSTDATALAGAANGARVVTSEPLPSGWLGKPWACIQGADSASGELLFFIDADAWCEPDGLARLLSLHEGTGGALSVQPSHRIETPGEEFSIFFNLVQMAGSGAFSVFRDARRAGLFGPSLLVGRDDYARAGTHEKVKDKVTEHYCLSRFFADAGVSTRAVSGEGLLSFRMYPGGLWEVASGWAKSVVPGAAETPLFLSTLCAAWLTGAVIAFTHPLPVVYVLYALQIMWLGRRAGTFRPWAALFFPVTLAFFMAVFFRSALRRSLKLPAGWKGRAVAVSS